MLKKNLFPLFILLSLIGVLFFSINCSEEVIYSGDRGGESDTTPPTATVEYSTTAPTNGNVIATMTASEPVTITNNGGSNSYTFTANGSFTFEFKDAAGNAGSVTATVANIDKTPPANPTISISPTTPTTGVVTVTITFSADSAVKRYKIGAGGYQSYTAPFTVSENTTIYAKAQDAVGNWSNERSLTISNIDTTAPTATVAYSTTAPTNGNVIATMTASEPVTITNNGGSNSYTFTANESFTFEFKDAAGNAGSATATVTNIDKTAPTATVAYSTTAPTNGNVVATITPNEPVTITNNGGSNSYTFTVNGSFTFEFKDAAGNAGSVTATVANIDKTPPANPTISIDPTTPTTGVVTVTITFSADSAVKRYKIGAGEYQSYTAPFTVSEDTTIYAKAQDAVGNWSGEVSYTITNIDKGNFNITIELVTPDNPVIDFGEFDNQLDKSQGETLDVSAVLDGATQWEWYLEGDSLGNTGNTCVINSALYEPGVYNLTLFAYKNGIMYSASIIFTIIN